MWVFIYNSGLRYVEIIKFTKFIHAMEYNFFKIIMSLKQAKKKVILLKTGVSHYLTVIDL